jgi:hypothetical protein
MPALPSLSDIQRDADRLRRSVEVRLAAARREVQQLEAMLASLTRGVAGRGGGGAGTTAAAATTGRPTRGRRTSAAGSTAVRTRAPTPRRTRPRAPRAPSKPAANRRRRKPAPPGQNRQRLLDAITEQPGRMSELVKRTGISDSPADRDLKKLIAEGLVVKVEQDGHPMYELATRAARK